MAKLYFARVFSHYYKYLVWNEKINIHSAQYFNGSGVQISAMEQNIFPNPSPPFWQNPPTSTTQQNITNVVTLPTYEASIRLPTYAHAVGVHEQKPTPSSY
uniref:Ovule protein n=1 Tax=Meloidogyne hapla TaxID=6305 RepID=A0A1I8AZT9_MELHA